MTEPHLCVGRPSSLGLKKGQASASCLNPHFSIVDRSNSLTTETAHRPLIQKQDIVMIKLSGRTCARVAVRNVRYRVGSCATYSTPFYQPCLRRQAHDSRVVSRELAAKDPAKKCCRVATARTYSWRTVTFATVSPMRGEARIITMLCSCIKCWCLVYIVTLVHRGRC